MSQYNAGDEKSKELFTKLLTHIGHTVTDCDLKIQKGVKRPDLISEKNGVKYCFELKQRYMTSDKFHDIMITDDKLWMVKQYQGKVYFVFFYADGVGYILDANTKPDEVRQVYAKATTRFWDQRMVVKNFLIWSVDKAQKFKFKPEDIY